MAGGLGIVAKVGKESHAFQRHTQQDFLMTGVVGEEREVARMITKFWLKQFQMVVILTEIEMTGE